MNVKQRLEALEIPGRLSNKTVEDMTDAELQAILDKDPVSKAILATLPVDELQLLADGDPAATARFVAKLKGDL